MEKKLVKLVGYSSTAKSGIGEYRDNKGRGLTGFYRNENENSFEVMELNKGHRVVSYKFPKVDIPFKSKMHSWSNLAFNCDWHYTKVKTKINKFEEVWLYGYKPIGFMAISNDATVYFDEMALEYTMTYKIGLERLLGMADDGIFEQCFDLEAFIKSYELLEEAHYGEQKGFIMNKTVKSKIRALSRREVTDCFEECLYGKTNSQYTLILAGLLFGHPIESTFARLVGTMVYNEMS